MHSLKDINKLLKAHTYEGKHNVTAMPVLNPVEKTYDLQISKFYNTPLFQSYNNVPVTYDAEHYRNGSIILSLEQVKELRDWLNSQEL